ncbi:MAG: cache domain-containing protein [Clostridia bacterium]|nr:cache domain-containing protein [Clostridia bacterium]
MSNLYRWLNNISIKRKNMVITFFGALLPISILLTLFAYQLYINLEARQATLIDSTAERIKYDLESNFEFSESMLLSYVSDLSFSALLSDASQPLSIRENREAILNIESKMETDLYSSPAFDQLYIYYDSDVDNKESEYIRPLSTIENQLWYQHYIKNPRNSPIIPTIEAGEVTLHFVKSLKKTDIYSPNIIYGRINGQKLVDLLSQEITQGLESRVYLIDPNNQVVASNKVIYKIYDETFMSKNDLSVRKGVTSVEIRFDQLYLKDWKIILLVESSYINQLLFNQLGMLLVTFMVIVVLIIILTHFVNQSINKRLYLLNDSMKQVDQG